MQWAPIFSISTVRRPEMAFDVAEAQRLFWSFVSDKDYD